MSTETTKKHPLQTILEEGGFEPYAYSGRGMYGQTCLGVQAKRSKVMSYLLGEGCSDDKEVRFSVANAVNHMATDRLGLDTVVYFRSVQFVEESEVEETAKPQHDYRDPMYNTYED